jgi:pyrimidine deaminase RibD-like protein
VEASDVLNFMRLAIAQGRKAVGKCEDNPPVGCVLVRDGIAVASGHTNAPGKPHAEAMAIAQLDNTGGCVVAFVTLEPCSFHGRTPSCAQALIAAGIERVYVGMIDPDARNNGRGIALLREAGVEVQVGVLEQEIATELRDYLGRAP